MTDKTPNVYQRILKASAVIDSMPWAKDLKNSQYQSVPIDDMRAGVRKACIEAGLVHILTGIEYEERKTEKVNFTFGRAIMRLVNADNPEEYVDFETVGKAMDSGDKDYGKFETNLIKNAYKMIFDIGEQGVDDIDAKSNEEIYDEAERIASKQRKQTTQAKPLSAEERRALSCKAVIRAWINEDIMEHGTNDILLAYSKKNGTMDKWPTELYSKCYDELVKSGVKLKEVSQ